jgi:hypothetical protein
MSYAALDAEWTDPPGPADVWAAGIGTTLHEEAQIAISRVYETAEFEVASRLGHHISGSTDALIDSQEILRIVGVTLGGTHVLWEFKTMGEYAFDQQLGYNRRSKTVGHEQGPKVGAITQAGMNALGIELTYPGRRIETILMGSVTPAQLSIKVAAGMGVQDFARYGAEWRIPRKQWEPLAIEEGDRMIAVAAKLDRVDGVLSDRTTPGSYLNPRGDKDWECDYCPYRKLCIEDGEGEIPVGQSWLTIRKKDDV